MGISEQAQGETKWRLGELALVRVHHGHASAGSLRLQQENGARPARKTSIFVVQKISSAFRHALTISFSSREDNFFLVFTVSVDGKEAWSVLSWSVDFEEALGRWDVRTNTVVPILCLWLARTPRRCCTSRILSCNRLVHALRLVVSCATSLSLSVWIVLSATEASCWGERHFLKLSVCLSFPLSFTIKFYGKKSIRSEIMALEQFFFCFCFERSIVDSLIEREKWRKRESLRERERDF